jgi:transcriptional regulator with XRE-family HTH domain
MDADAPIDLSTFAGRLRELRRLKGLTQDQLATACKLPQTSISRWEHGVPPGVDVVEKIAATFADLSLEWLLRGSGEPLKAVA